LMHRSEQSTLLAQTKRFAKSRSIALDASSMLKRKYGSAAMRKLYAAEAKALDQLLVARIDTFTFPKAAHANRRAADMGVGDLSACGFLPLCDEDRE
jgi:hypothetical protein